MGDIADVEATAVDAVFTLPVPAHHRIVGPLTRRQAERTTADPIVNMPLTAPLKLQRRAYCITNRQTRQCTLSAIQCLVL
ncbi:hypothetical protein D3C80_1947720 [compost metagenome]